MATPDVSPAPELPKERVAEEIEIKDASRKRVREEADDLEDDGGEGRTTESRSQNSGKKESTGTEREKKESIVYETEPGRSVLPFARVQKILGADQELPLVVREAVFILSRATEEFIKRLTQEGQRAAESENRTSVQRRDMVAATRRVDGFAFLNEIVACVMPKVPPKKVKKAATKDNQKESARPLTMLDQFIHRKEKSDAEPEPGIVMNEDGTMHVGDTEEES